MNISRYIEIKAAMPDSMRMKLDHIKRYLDEGKAAALIGAGFSKNAKIPEAAENYVVSKLRSRRPWA